MRLSGHCMLHCRRPHPAIRQATALGLNPLYRRQADLNRKFSKIPSNILPEFQDFPDDIMNYTMQTRFCILFLFSFKIFETLNSNIKHDKFAFAFTHVDFDI